MRPVTVFSRQTPAGERVLLRQLLVTPRADEFTTPLLGGWSAFGSGTMALAAALFFAADRHQPGKSVILPAYSCPDIVAAALCAGLEPAFADLAKEQTGMNLAALHSSRTPGSSVAVLVELFGTRHEIPAHGETAAASRMTLVHDRAQSLAGPGVEVDSAADLVVVSRGRGNRQHCWVAVPPGQGRPTSFPHSPTRASRSAPGARRVQPCGPPCTISPRNRWLLERWHNCPFCTLAKQGSERCLRLLACPDHGSYTPPGSCRHSSPHVPRAAHAPSRWPN